MKKITTLILLVPFFVQGQDLAISRTKFKYRDFSLITSVKWRQLPQAGNSVTTIVNPDSLNTRVLNINKAGIYKYELAITFLNKNGSVTARDTVRVIASPPVKDSVFVVDKFQTSKSIEIVSRVQSTMKVQVLNGSIIVQNYATVAYSGVRILWVTGLKAGYVIRITLNGKIYNL